MSCIKAAGTAKLRNCVHCGTLLSRTASRLNKERCKVCMYKERAAKAQQNDRRIDVICTRCGTPFKSVEARYSEVHLCSRRCVSLDYHARLGHNAGSVRTKILEYLKTRGSYGTVADICEDLRLSEKSIFRFSLSVPGLNYEAGTGPKPDDRFPDKAALEAAIIELLKQRGYLKIAEICKVLDIARHALQHRDIAMQPLYDKLKLKEPLKHDAAELSAKIAEYIRARGHYCTVQQIIEALHIDHRCALMKNKIDVDAINKDTGFKRPPGISSYFEELAYKELCEVFGKMFVNRQKRFIDCISDKKGRLRFDFYLDTYNVLIEVDGAQHHDRSNKRFTERMVRNDKAKNEYARNNGIPLYRLMIVRPESVFLAGLQRIIDDVRGTLDMFDTTVISENGRYKTSLIAGISDAEDTTATGSNTERECVKSASAGTNPTDNQAAEDPILDSGSTTIPTGSSGPGY